MIELSFRRLKSTTDCPLDPNIKDITSEMPLTRKDRLRRDRALKLRKKELLYRMVHFNDPLPNLDINVGGRDKELTYPFIQLFYGTRYQNIITDALQKLLDEMNKTKRNTLSVVWCKIVGDLLISSKSNKLRMSEIWDALTSGKYLEGNRIDEDKKDRLESSDFGKIYRNNLPRHIKNEFKTDYKHGNAGGIWTFDIDSIINRIDGMLYDRTKIKINVLEDGSDSSDTADAIIRRYEGIKHLLNSIEDQDISNELEQRTMEDKLNSLSQKLRQLEDDNQKSHRDSGLKRFEQRYANNPSFSRMLSMVSSVSPQDPYTMFYRHYTQYHRSSGVPSNSSNDVNTESQQMLNNQQLDIPKQGEMITNTRNITTCTDVMSVSNGITETKGEPAYSTVVSNEIETVLTEQWEKEEKESTSSTVLQISGIANIAT